jgi:hypothetical protein
MRVKATLGGMGDAGRACNTPSWPTFVSFGIKQMKNKELWKNFRHGTYGAPNALVEKYANSFPCGSYAGLAPCPGIGEMLE